MRFSLMSDPLGGTSVAEPVLANEVAVTNGKFSVRLPIRDGVFVGTPWWMEIEVRPAGDGAFTKLAPRQEVGTVASALYARNAGQAGRADLATEALTARNVSNAGHADIADQAIVARNVPWLGIQGVPSWMIAPYEAGEGLSLIDHTFSIRNAGVGPAQLAPRAVTADKMNSGGALAGELLTAGGAGAQWGGTAKIQGDLSVSKNLTVGEALTVGKGAVVAGDLTSRKDISAGNNVYAISNISANVNLTAGDSVLALNQMIANNDITTGRDLIARRDVVAKQDVVATRDVVGLGAVVGVGPIIAKQDLIVNGGLIGGAGSPLKVGSVVGLGDAVLKVVGNISVEHNVNAQAFFADDVYTTSVHAQNFFNTSDRNLKQDFQEVDCEDVLTRLSALPVSNWAFKSDASTRHIGPMAQDFRASFGLGSSETSIALVDEMGVALAAVKGLNEKVQRQAVEIEAKNAVIADLLKRMAALEQGVSQLRAGAR